MEKYIKFLITVSIIIAVLLLLVIVAVVVYSLRARAKAEKLLKDGKRSGNFIYELLRTSFPKGRLFRRVMLPLLRQDGTAVSVPADLILVDRGGVFVIRQRNIGGNLFNPREGNWQVQNSRGIAEIPNPFRQNQAALRALEAILRQENIYNVPLHNLVVFTGKNVRFRYRQENLLTAENVIEAIRDLNRNRFLNQNEIFSTVAAIRKALPKREPSGNPQSSRAE